MKVTIELDCTPIEARELLGLPDVRAMQLAVTKELEAKMSASLDKLSPDALFKDWFSLDPRNSERIQDLFANFVGRALKRPDG